MAIYGGRLTYNASDFAHDNDEKLFELVRHGVYRVL